MLTIDQTLLEINDSLATNNSEKIKEIIHESNINDVAYLLSHTDENFLNEFLAAVISVKKEELPDMVPELSNYVLNRFIRYCFEMDSTRLIQDVFSGISNDDSVNILSVIDKKMAAWIIGTIRKGDYNEMIPLLSYPEETAGRIMTTDFISVNEHSTVEEVLDQIKKHGDRVETTNSIYITDSATRLKGVLSLRELLFRSNETRVSDIMQTDVLSVNVLTDQEAVAKQVEHYNLSVMPVIDNDNLIKGIITVDDVIDIIRAETTEDIMKMAGSESGDLYEPSSWKSFRRRAPWLLVSFLGGMVTVKIMYWLSNMVPRPEFLAFVPVIIGMSGNIASQSTTILVRGLATGKIHISKLWRVLGHEVLTALMLGALFGFLLFFTSQLEFQGVAYLGICVSLSITLSMIVASFFATILPILFNYVSIDPAVATGPFVTVSIDIIGIFVYIGTILIVTGLFAA